MDFRVPHEMLLRIFDELDLSIMVFSKDRKVLFANKASGITPAGESPPLGAAEIGHFAANEYYDESGAKLDYPNGSVIDDALKGKETHGLTIEHRDTKRHTQRWLSISCVPVVGDGGEFSYGILWYRDISLRKKREYKLKFLIESAKILSLTAEFEQRLKEKARLAVPTLADWCSIDIAGKGGPRRVALVHKDPEKLAIVEDFERRSSGSRSGSSALMRVLTTGTPEFHPIITPQMIARAENISEEQREDIEKLGLTSFMIVPIKSGSMVLGALTFAYAESGRTYTQDDFQFMQEFATHLGILFENSQLYEEIRERDRSKDTFLALLSHELRNPLAPIISALEHLQLTNADPQFEEQLRMIRHQFDHIARLLNDMLDVTRYTRGKIELDHSNVDLLSLVDNVVTSNKKQIRSTGIAIHVVHPEKLELFTLDATRIEQALHNLLSNAIKFTPRGGDITIELSERENNVVIKVRDTGKGILPEELDRIFEPYYQSSRTSQGTGLGVGLMLVREIVRLHGGTIEASSPGADLGSEFTLTLPRINRTVRDRQSGLVPRWKEGGARHILVVDDNSAAADALCKLLKHLGWNAHAAYSAKEALEHMRANDVDLMFLDIGMPEMNGYELVSLLRKDGSTLPIIALSGYGMEDDKRQAKSVGFTDHLTKPISAHELRQALMRSYGDGASSVHA
jgi:signal transduction histidine kinase/ActR/RegA family two-component response regulator